LRFPEQTREKIDGYWQDDRLIILGGYFNQALKKPEMHGHRIFRNHFGRVSELLRSLIFAFGMDYFRAPFPLGFCLFGHGAAHFLRQIDIFQLYQDNFDAPRVRLRV